jgi:hypothetical protein
MNIKQRFKVNIRKFRRAGNFNPVRLFTLEVSVMSENRNATIINGVEYVVKSFFRENARETAEQKIIRLVRECVKAEIKNTEVSVLRSN